MDHAEEAMRLITIGRRLRRRRDFLSRQLASLHFTRAADNLKTVRAELNANEEKPSVELLAIYGLLPSGWKFGEFQKEANTWS